MFKCLPSISKLLLIQTKWNAGEIAANFTNGGTDCFLESKRIKPANKPLINSRNSKVAVSINSLEELSYIKCANNTLAEDLSINLTKKLLCNVCLQSFFLKYHLALVCEHYYCQECWKNYLQYNISNGQATNIECMSTDCNILVPCDFVEFIFANTSVKDRYDKLSFRDCIQSHPLLQECPNFACSTIIKSNESESKAKRVICKDCNSSYCFKCGCEYHAPTDCKTIKLWLTKCADDSETAHYISANTKDCPECGTCIEKNGGCNHMKCYSCKYEFCWMCLGMYNIQVPFKVLISKRLLEELLLFG